MSKMSMGAALGQAIAGYRDKDTKRCAEGLVGAVEQLRDAEDRIAELEREIAEHRVALGAARAEALEECARLCTDMAAHYAAKQIRALAQQEASHDQG